MKKGNTLIEVVVILALVAIFLILIMAYFQQGKTQSTDEPYPIKSPALKIKCNSNLSMIGKGLMIYRDDYGRSVRFPNANGAYFLGRLYKVHIMPESTIFLCPGTQDQNQGQNLGADSEIEPAWISYAGRKNENQKQYPGIYKLFKDTALTTMASDDWEAGPNHENGKFINFLFVDGHVDKIIYQSLQDDNYEVFKTQDDKLADPLTN